MTTISNHETAKQVAIQNANLLRKAIVPDPSLPLAAIASFPGKFIFEQEAMTEYVKDNFSTAESARIETSQGSDIEEYATKMSNNFSASGSYNFSPASSVSGSVTADFNCSSESRKSVSFSQVRKVAKFGDINLPSPLLRDKLRALAAPDVLALIDNITTQDEAERFVAIQGAVYIDTAQIGATLTMSSRSEGTSISSEKDLTTALQLEMNNLLANAAAENEYTIGTNKSKITTDMKTEITVYGGEAASILKGDEGAWIESMKDHPTVTSYRLAPISNLAKSGSNAEQLLLKAVGDVCKGARSKFKVIEDPPLDGTYSIRSVDNGDGLYLNIDIGNKRNGGKIHQWAYPQKWVLTQTNSDGEPIITLQSTESKLYLNIDIGNKRNGGKIHQWNYPQKWKLEKKSSAPDGSQIVSIRSLESNLHLNVDIGNKRNGGKIYQWGYPQMWKLVREQD